MMQLHQTTESQTLYIKLTNCDCKSKPMLIIPFKMVINIFQFQISVEENLLFLAVVILEQLKPSDSFLFNLHLKVTNKKTNLVTSVVTGPNSC